MVLLIDTRLLNAFIPVTNLEDKLVNVEPVIFRLHPLALIKFSSGDPDVLEIVLDVILIVPPYTSPPSPPAIPVEIIYTSLMKRIPIWQMSPL